MSPQPPRPPRSRRRVTGFTILATVAVAVFGLTGSALAAPGTGQVKLSLTAKGDSSLLGQGVKVTYSAKAGKTGATKRAGASVADRRHHKGKGGSASAVKLPVFDLELGETSTVRTAGALKLASGGSQALLRGLTLQLGDDKGTISARLGKKRLVVFRVAGRPTVDAGSLKLNGATLSLTGNGADALEGPLGLDSLGSGRVGTLGVEATLSAPATKEAPKTETPKPDTKDPDPVELDPYFAQCAVSAVTEAEGDLPAAGALPSMSTAKPTTAPTSITWGFRTAFRGYVSGGGSMHALDGATTVGPAPMLTGFDFPVSGGAYEANSAVDATDDQAVVESSGTALFCGTVHGFRVAISNPTVVIDGEDSRIVADIDTTMEGVLTPPQRIDLATLDLTGITPTYAQNGSQVSWGSVPAALTAEGAEAICGTGACPYVEGTALDSIDVAVKTAYVEPYFAQCAVSATGEVEGDLPAAGALPSMTTAKATTAPTSVTWGFRTAFRGYISGGGSMHALDGATTVGPPPVLTGFSFPVAEGAYEDNDPVDMTDDQAVVESEGTALFCGTPHGFRVAISNPTVVIDGEDSRIVADIDTTMDDTRTPPQRIDLATLNLAGITPFYNHSGSEVTWGTIPAALTAEGATAICGGGACSYVEGTALDSIDVAVKTAYDTADLNALATYVASELPFPIPAASSGGCTLPVPDGTTQGKARTIDEYLAIGPNTAFQWKPNADRPAATPNLTGKTALTGGEFAWGLRNSLRGSINATGEFNPALGATASHSTYYGNGGLTPVSPPRIPEGEMGSTSGRHFKWPAAATAGFYDAGAAGDADDRLVLQTAGRVGFCQTGTNQWYGTVLSNPTIVIDGANSRITIDVATRYRLSWVRGVVDLASLDLSGATFASSEDGGVTTVSWTFPDAVSNVGPVELTKAGEAVVNVLSSGTYLEGLGLDGTTIKASFPTPAP